LLASRTQASNFALLKRFELGEIAMDEALRIVGRAQKLMGEIRAEIAGEVPDDMPIWDAVEAFAEKRKAAVGEIAFVRQHGALAVKAFQLREEVRKNFTPGEKE
jgi:hypothetical protein